MIYKTRDEPNDMHRLTIGIKRIPIFLNLLLQRYYFFVLHENLLIPEEEKKKNTDSRLK